MDPDFRRDDEKKFQLYTDCMAIKKIIQDSFEQIAEVGHDMAKSSAKQIKETFNPWDIIKNGLTDSEKQNANLNTKSKELQGKDAKHTPLNLDTLTQNYADQDKKNMEVLQRRLFQMGKRDEENSLLRSKQQKAEKERSITQEEMELKRREEEKKRQQNASAAPQGKTGRGSALSGKKKRQATEPQPAETKPGSSKQ